MNEICSDEEYAMKEEEETSNCNKDVACTDEEGTNEKSGSLKMSSRDTCR